MPEVTLAPWSDADRPLLDIANAPEMTRFLGGPETPEQVDRRHANYLRFWRTGEARVFRVDADGEPAGSIGWWSTTWTVREDAEVAVHETGWFTIPSAQGRGIAAAALGLLIEDVRAHAVHDLLLAFPSVENPASNALCARAGFERHGEEEFPFRGVVLRVAAWVLLLRSPVP